MVPAKSKIFVLLFSAGIIIALSSCNNGSPAAEEELTVITPVTVTSVNFKAVSEEVQLPAVSTFLNRNIVRSATTGIIESVGINPGDYVKKGQALFALKTREASVISSALKNDTAFSFKGEISVTASKDGVISSLSHQNGDFVQEGDELAVISDESSFVFLLEVPYELRVYVEKNRSCKILMTDGKMLDAIISGRLPEMDTQAQTIKYLIKPSGAWHLPANLNVMVTIVKNYREKAAVLPKASVLGNETQDEFWIMKMINDSTAVKIGVKKGIEINDEVEITEPGLLPSDRIVVTGGYGLPDTARVIIK